ncbi:hypothetical protein [Mesorhizobium sp. 10J20-29]
MNARFYPITYSYAPDDLVRIKEQFEKLGKERHLEYYIPDIEKFASDYINSNAYSSSLPDRKTIEEEHDRHLRIMDKCRDIVISSCMRDVTQRALPGGLCEDPDYSENDVRDREILDLCKSFQDQGIIRYEFLRQMAVRALDCMIEDGRTALCVKDGRERQYRRFFINNVSEVWAALNDCDLRECTISAVDGSPMLEFIKACLDPVTEVTGEAAGSETIKNIVNQLKRELLSRERVE